MLLRRSITPHPGVDICEGWGYPTQHIFHIAIMGCQNDSKKKADTSPRILNLLLDHCIGKPVEQVQHRGMQTFIIHTVPKDNAEDAEVVECEMVCLPEGEKQP